MFIYFSEEQKQRANAVDLEDFLMRHNEKLLRSGREKRLASDHSITIRGNEWYDHASREGGLAIDFVKKYYSLDFPGAMSMLLGEEGETYRITEKKTEPRKPFELPKANQDMRRVFAYLTKTRLLNRAIVSEFMKAKLIYEDAEFHNAVFVGYDANGTARHAHKRGTYTRGGNSYKGNVDGCDPRYSFHYTGQSDTVYVFEAPIDLLSFITLYPKDWKKHSYVSLCGVAEHALRQMLADNASIKKVALCLDHDAAGIEAAGCLAETLEKLGYQEVFIIQSRNKDWNEDIKARQGISAVPAQEHPQLLFCASICSQLMEENTGKEAHSVPDLLEQVSILAMSRSFPLDRKKSITDFLLRMISQLLTLRQEAFSQSGQPVPKKNQMLKELYLGYRPHQNLGSLQNKMREIKKMLQEANTQITAPGRCDYKELSDNFKSLALECVRAQILAELSWQKMSQMMKAEPGEQKMT